VKRPTNDDEYEIDGCMVCDSMLDGLPAEWSQWPLGISVGFTQTPSTCVYGALFREYSARSMTEALEKLFAIKNRDLFVGYRFHTRGLIPLYDWYAEWPLARRGKIEQTNTCIGSDLTSRWLSRGVRPRERMQGAAPWETETEDTIFQIWNEPVTVFGYQTVKMLSVGGRTVDEAVRNWDQTARVIRALKRSLE